MNYRNCVSSFSCMRYRGSLIFSVVFWVLWYVQSWISLWVQTMTSVLRVWDRGEVYFCHESLILDSSITFSLCMNSMMNTFFILQYEICRLLHPVTCLWVLRNMYHNYNAWVWEGNESYCIPVWVTRVVYSFYLVWIIALMYFNSMVWVVQGMKTKKGVWVFRVMDTETMSMSFERRDIFTQYMNLGLGAFCVSHVRYKT